MSNANAATETTSAADTQDRAPATGSSSTASSSTNNRGSSNQRNGRNNGTNNASNRNSRNNASRFRGAVTELQDFVFCMPREQSGIKPFHEVRDQLGLYVNKHYPKVSTYFRPVFDKDNNTDEPVAVIPEIPTFDPGPEPASGTAAHAAWTLLQIQYSAMASEAIKSGAQTYMQHRSLLKNAVRACLYQRVEHTTLRSGKPSLFVNKLARHNDIIQV